MRFPLDTKELTAGLTAAIVCYSVTAHKVLKTNAYQLLKKLLPVMRASVRFAPIKVICEGTATKNDSQPVPSLVSRPSRAPFAY
jgi:hypothetical protein